MAQRSKSLSFAQWLERCGGRREEALLMAHSQSGISMTALAAELGLSAGRVSQLIKKAQKARTGELL